jgi:dTDP-4-dehydrorhamnose 3,5-epimerase-like enzyme
LWPFNVAISIPVFVSHNFKVLSSEQERIIFPSGEKWQSLTFQKIPSVQINKCDVGRPTIPVCPSRVVISLPVTIFHNFKVLSHEQETMILSSGEKAAALT